MSYNLLKGKKMESLENGWKTILNALAKQVTSISFDLWINNLSPIEIKDNVMILSSTSDTVKQQCLKNHSFLILDSIQDVYPSVVDFKILSPEEQIEYGKKSAIQEAEVKRENPFNPKYTFDNFVVGKSNQYVYAAAKSVAENPGTRFNPLFIYGGVGLGKTHLLHSIGNYIFKNNPTLKIVYSTCENFTNDYIETLSDKTKSISAFREKYRNVDVLMIDDIQFISKKTGTQEEFFHTFDNLYQNNKQIVISSDRAPKDIATLEERLSSRFNSGLTQDIQAPDYETRLAILQKKAELEHYDIDIEALTYLADNVSSNIRELEGYLSKTMFITTLMGKHIASVSEAKEAIKDIKDEQVESLSPEKIIDCTCKYFNITKEDIVGKKRDKEIVMPRQICMYLINNMLDLPLSSIGKLFGGRDHTTIIHARDKIVEDLEQNKNLEITLDDIKSLINEK
jgi:chromosomal replication initiator protein